MQSSGALDAVHSATGFVAGPPTTHGPTTWGDSSCHRGDGAVGSPSAAAGRRRDADEGSPSTPPRWNSGAPSSLTSRLSSGGRRLTSLLVESPRKASKYLLRGAERCNSPGGSLSGGDSGTESCCTPSRRAASPHGGAPNKKKPKHHDNRGTLRRCPPEVMHYIFQLVMRQSQSFACIYPLSLVCRYWYHLTQHGTMWMHVAKQFFVAYPVVQRLTRAAPIDAEEEAAFRRLAYRAVPLFLTTSTPSTGGGTTKAEATAVSVPSTTATAVVAQSGDHTTGHHRSSSVGGGSNVELQGGQRALATSPHLQAPSAQQQRGNGTATTTTTMDPPSNRTIRKGLKDLKKYIARRRYHELVQRRRAFVIHAFFSLALLCMSMTLLTAMCAAERLDPITVCNHETSFHFLWLTFVSIVGAVISNIVMETHFEPQPLIRRLRMHTQLIQVSAGALSLGMLFIGLPALLIQWNVRDKTMPWVMCLTPVFLALLLWQVEVLVSVRADIRQFLDRPYFNTMTMYHGFSNSTPTLFIIALGCLAEYLERDGAEADWLLLFLGTLPGGLALFTLTIVFLLDYSLKNQASDFIAGMCMAVANICPILIATTHRFRGFMLLPIVLAAFGFFVGHFNDLRKRLDAAMFDPDGERMLFDED